MINVHAAKKATPPSGVIAPSTLIFVNANTNRLPENSTIPANINQPEEVSNEFPGNFATKIPTTNSPNA